MNDKGKSFINGVFFFNCIFIKFAFKWGKVSKKVSESSKWLSESR